MAQLQMCKFVQQCLSAIAVKCNVYGINV